MKLSRKIFINQRNNQASITLPSKVLKKLQEESKLTLPPKRIFIEIFIPGHKKVEPINIG